MKSDLTRTLEDEIERLEEKARIVLEAKRANRPRRPLLVEFCGSPKAGKTSAISSLEIFLKRNGFTVEVLTERASVCPISDKKGWTFNVWTGCSAVAQILEKIDAPERGSSDIVICDRGIFDALIWFDWLSKQRRLDAPTKAALEGFFKISLFRASLDLVLAFKAEPKTSIEREYAHLLTRKKGTIMNEATLDSYIASIDATIASQGDRFRNIISMDTSTLDQEEVGMTVTESVLNAMSEALEERVASLDADTLEELVKGDQVFPFDKLAAASLPIGYDVRSDVEQDATRVQPIPVVVITDSERKRVVAFLKSDRAVKKGSAESGRTLLYAGGHVRAEDEILSESNSLAGILQAGLNREMREELGSIFPILDDEPFCIWERDVNQNRSRHMAICYIVQQENLEGLKLSLDSYEFLKPGARNQNGRVIEAGSLKDTRLEFWSQTILAQVFSVGTQGSLFDQ